MDPLPEQEHFEVSILHGRSTVMPLTVRVFVELDFFLHDPDQLQGFFAISSPGNSCFLKSKLL
jgi:hypothetical protein